MVYTLLSSVSRGVSFASTGICRCGQLGQHRGLMLVSNDKTYAHSLIHVTTALAIL